MAPDLTPVPSDIELHLREITRRWAELGEPALLELVFLSADDKAIVKDVRHFAPDEVAEAARHVAAMNVHHLNAYAVVNPVNATNRPATGKRASAEHILGSFFHWADGDSPEAAQNIRNFVGARCTMHVLTGATPHDRPHVYWELEEPTRNLAAWEATQRAIAATLKTDPSVVDPPRIMRIAGTINWPKPKKRAKGYIAEITRLRVYDRDARPPISAERMARAFAARPSEKPFIDTGTGDHRSADDYADILRRARTDGEKHTGVRDLAASLAGQGVSPAMARAIIREACPVWDDNVEGLIESAYQKFYRQPEAYATAAEIDFDAPPPTKDEAAPSPLEWFDDIEPVLADAYLVKGVIAAGAMSVVYGPSNSGKTFLALDLAFHVATETTWHGRRVKQAAVLYLAAEGGRGVANRIAALKAETGCCDVPLALRRAGLDLLKSNADLQHIANLVAELKAKHPDLPVLIVIDTLSRVMAGGDENSAADMTALIRNVDAIREKTGAHIMVVHHTGKDTARGARGHSSLRAATDTEIEVANEDGARAAMVTKQRDYVGGETFAFGLKSVSLGHDQDGDEVTSCVVEWQDAEDFTAARKAGKGRGKNQQIIMETFDQMVSEGMARGNPGGVGMPDPGRFWAVEIDALRGLAQGKMAGDRPSALFRQAWDALTARDGLFCSGHNLCWRIDRRKP